MVDGVTPVTGSDGGQGGIPAIVPNFYLIWNQSSDLKFGIGVNAPYGLKIDYDTTWLGRYQDITTALKTINVNPSIAYRIDSQWSVGGGFNIQYAEAKLAQGIDFGSACVGALGAGACGGLGLLPQMADGIGVFRGEDVSYGLNFGALYQWTPETRIGFHYRSKIEHEFDGKTEFGTPAAAAAITGGNTFITTDSKAKLPIPASMSLSALHQMNDRWTVMGDLTHTRWNSFEEVRINFGTPQAPNVIPEYYNNVTRYALGTTYKWNSALKLRGGLAYDESPSSDRSPGVPDSDRYIVGVGFAYQYMPNIVIDVGYQHLFFKEGDSNRLSATNSRLIGHYDIDVDVLAVGLTWTF